MKYLLFIGSLLMVIIMFVGVIKDYSVFMFICLFICMDN